MRRSLLWMAIAFALPATALARPLKTKAEFATGIGLGAYTKDLGRATDLGFSWNLRFGLIANSIFGGEISYQGLTADTDNVILANGVLLTNFQAVQQAFSVNARAGVPINVSDSQFYIYGLVGAGYSYIWFTQGGFLSGANNDSAFLVPFGGGLSFMFPSGLMLDSRFTYNLLTGERSNFFRTGDSWTVGFNVGARFRL